MICEECGFLAKNFISLGTHITEKHFHPKIYFDKWVKDENDGICKYCGNETKYLRISDGYSKTCSAKCIRAKTCETNVKKYGCDVPTMNKDVLEKRKNNYFNKHGVYHQMHDEKIKEKIADTNIRKYGNKCTLNNASVKEKKEKTFMKNYGTIHPFQNETIKNNIKKNNFIKYGIEFACQTDKARAKTKSTNLAKYGVEYLFQSKRMREEIKKTNLAKYGVEYCSQNEEIFNKQQKSAMKVHEYEDIYYQGSYEKDFLDKYYEYYDIKRGPRIPYVYLEFNKIYYSDFLLPEYNLIVEIKNGYLYTKDFEKNQLKREACIKNGFLFIFIIDKNYDDFNILIKNLHINE